MNRNHRSIVTYIKFEFKIRGKLGYDEVTI